MIAFFCFSLTLAISCTAMDNPFLHTIPLNGPVKFSPDGKHLLIFEKENVAVYETGAGRKKGNLPDIPKKYSALEGERLFAFSPQGTYATFAKKLCHIWNLKTVQKHLADILISGEIVWNSQETRFISVPKSGGRHNISRLYDAQTGEILHVIDHTEHQHIPDHISLNDDGSMAAFIFPYNGTIAEIHNISPGTTFTTLNNPQQVAFCSDNIHALIAQGGNEVLVYNKNKNNHTFPTFHCASSGHMFDGSKLHNNRLKMHIHGLQTTVKNEGRRRERYIITQDGNTFTAAQHYKPFAKEKTILGNTGSLALIKKNRKVPFPGGLAYYDLYLKRLRSSEQQEVQLLGQVPSVSNGIKFSSSHDEHLLIADPIKNLLYVFNLPARQQIGAMKYREIRISPDGHSFALGDSGEKRTLYILPRAIDILSKEEDSYFRLLPPELRADMKNMKTA